MITDTIHVKTIDVATAKAYMVSIEDDGVEHTRWIPKSIINAQDLIKMEEHWENSGSDDFSEDIEVEAWWVNKELGR